MAPPTVHVNTFVKENEKQDIDPVSKMFIITEVMFGVNRMPLLGKGHFVYVFMTFVIFIIVNVPVIYITVCESMTTTLNYTMVITIMQNVITTLLSFIRCKWVRCYYSKLRKFDVDAGCRSKISVSSIQNAVQAGLTCIFLVVFCIVPFQIGILEYNLYRFIPVHVVYVLELHYIGHLLSFLTQRLKLINYYIEGSLSRAQVEPSPVLKEFAYFKSYDAQRSQCQMRKLMDLYELIVEAYAFLIEGVKWQLLVVIITAFISVLNFLYTFVLNIIEAGWVLSQTAVLPLGIVLIIMPPLFAPCVFGDRVHNEVTKMRELLASKLYENKLDKSGRSVARALLSFTETRDLSFRLLRMLNIDISMPFKFIGLLVTYLIILLQFEKVMNPKTSL